MPEANVLYTVTGAVVVGLVVWVAMVLRTAKDPWVRPAPAAGELPSEEAPASESGADPGTSELPAPEGDDASKLDADDTARATPVALSEGRAKAAEPTKDAAKADGADAEAKDDAPVG